MINSRLFVVLSICISITACSGSKEQTSSNANTNNLTDEISTGENAAKQCAAALDLYVNTVKSDMAPCQTCHVTSGIAASTQLILNADDATALSGINVYLKQFDRQTLLNKTIGLPSHVGGAVFNDASSQSYKNLDALLVDLAACNDDIVVPDTETPPVPDPTPDNSLSLARGESLWGTLACAACHGDVGDGIPQGSSIISSLSRSDVVQVTVDTMPLGNAATCDVGCAEDIVAYLRSINGIQAPVDNGNGTPVDGGSSPTTFNQKQLLKQLYKASMNLLSRVPDQSWVDLVVNQQQAGLRLAVNEMLEDESFYFRLREIYTPLLVSGLNPLNAYARMFNGSIDWFNEFTGADLSYARNQIRVSMNQEPLRLIEYVVRNNKPFTEILTAQYALLNYFSARSLNQLSNVDFQVLANPVNATFPYSVDEYKRVDITAIPLAGVLTSNQFVQKYPTSGTNVNRHRAYNVYKYFLDTDIFEISGSRITTGDIVIDNPTLNNPNCTGCHNVLDPVSSSFRHWQQGSARRADYTQVWNQANILPPGLNGQLMPDNEPAPMQWLAQQMATDKRFAVATVKTFFTEITGYALLLKPDVNASTLQINRYDYQQSYIRILADSFISNAYDLKFLIKELIKSDFFYGTDFNGGSFHLLSTDRLKRKILSTAAVSSFTASGNLLNANVYQGTQTSGIMSLIQRYSASQIACRAVAPDMAKMPAARLLLPAYDLDASPFDANGVENTAVHLQIKQNLKNLMWVLWAEDVAVNDPDLLAMYERYLKFLSLGVSEAGINISTTCDAVAADGRVIRADADYQIRAWITTVNLMLDDVRFLYE